MFETYRHLIRKYPKISLYHKRRLIKQAQGRSKAKKEELVLRHIWFVIFRINKIAFPAYSARFGEEILSQTIFILYDKIKTYDLRYRDKYGNPKPVRFCSYIWKRVDGFIIDYLKREISDTGLQESFTRKLP